MKLLFKQRLFSWLDSYDIYDEYDNIAYVVKGKLSFGHLLNIFSPDGTHLGTVEEEPLTFFVPKFFLYEGKDNYIGQIRKEFTFFKPRITVDFNNWEVDGDWFEWDYSITDGDRTVAEISKDVFHLTDTYVIDIDTDYEYQALHVLMLVLAIDAEKCSRS